MSEPQVLSFYNAAQAPPFCTPEQPDPARLPPQLIIRQITSDFLGGGQGRTSFQGATPTP